MSGLGAYFCVVSSCSAACPNDGQPVLGGARCQFVDFTPSLLYTLATLSGISDLTDPETRDEVCSTPVRFDLD